MQKSKINIEPLVLDKITGSNILTDNEKISFLKYIWYMTLSERKELIQLV